MVTSSKAGVPFSVGVGFFYSFSPPDQLWGTIWYPSNQWESQPFITGEHEADHSRRPSSEIKNAWRFTTIPSILQGVILRHKVSSTFLPIIYLVYHSIKQSFRVVIN